MREKYRVRVTGSNLATITRTFNMSVTKLMVSLVCPAVDCIMEEGKKDSRYKTEESEMWQAETLLHMQSSHAIDHTTVLSEHVHPRGEKTYGVSCLYSCGWASHPYYPIILEV